MMLQEDEDAGTPAGVVSLHAGDSARTPVAVFIGVFFVTVATILGTGILALPVELHRCGFGPFMFEFSIALFAQAAVVVLVVELLQHTVSTMRKHAAENAGGVELQAPLAAAGAASSDSAEAPGAASPDRPGSASPAGSSGSAGGAGVSVSVSAPKMGALPAGRLGGVAPADEAAPPGLREREHTDLHTMGHLFLKSPWLRVGFNLAILFHFVTVLTSYGVAGPQAFGQLLGVPALSLTAPYVLLLTLVVVFGQRFLNSTVSAMTFAKGTLLVLVVAITGAVASKADQPYDDDWSHIADPFLVTTVALGGAINVLPVYFQRISFNRGDVRRFRLAALAGLLAVWVLNALWALFLLQVVPQTGDPSLTSAKDRGQIASVPLSDVIRADYPQYKWVLWITRVFVAISVSVSFIALGSGLKHLLDGLAFHLREMPRLRETIISQAHMRRAQHALYAVFFGVVLVVALTASDSFFVILDTWTSLALNLESGFFVVLMVLAARAAGLPTPEGVPPYGKAIVVFVGGYFGLAVLYDMIALMAGW